MASPFAIPSSLPDLERPPYNLLPYPSSFNDEDEFSRAESFNELVSFLDACNDELNNASMSLFDETYIDEERMQALYTLVRKSTSLSKETRQNLAQTLCDSVRLLCIILESTNETAPQHFRDAFCFYLYMLYSFLFFSVSSKDLANRSLCCESMLRATQTMNTHQHVLWKRGVADETVALLPCKIAYLILEASTGVVARKQACGDLALSIIATVLSNADESILSNVTASLMDLMCNFEHMSPMVSELCATLDDPKLGVELLREIGRLESAMGTKHVGSFVHEYALAKPKVVLQHLSFLLPHLQSEPYHLRSSILTAISHILVFLGRESTNGEIIPEVQKNRSALLTILHQRVYDTSSFTRSATMKGWIRLIESHSIPKDQFLAVCQLAMDRLQDRTVLVRRQAMVLLTKLLENNPFLASLDPAPYRAKLGELYDYVKNNMPEEIKQAQSEVDIQDEEQAQEVEEAALAAAIEQADAWIQEAENLSDVQQEFCSKVTALKFTQSALDFIDTLEGSDALESMLLSANTSDVTEALRFFVQARHFQLPCAVTGMKRALALMWSTEASIKSEVLKAFVDVFVVVPGTEDRLPSEDIARNLMALTSQATVSELASIEEAIVVLVKEEKIPDEIFLILWSFVSKSSESKATALQLLAMGARADRSIIDSKSRLKLLLEAGMLSEPNNWKLSGAAAVCLQRVARAEVDPSDAKFLVMERIQEELCTLCQGENCQDSNPDDTLQWFSTAEQAVKALFVISPEPEVACRDILVGMYEATLRSEEVHSLRLARFFHVLGHIALNLLVYTEALSASVRRANAKRSLKKQEEADHAKRSSVQGDEEEDAIEAELGVAAQAEAENERRLADIAENEIVGRNLISMFGPLLVRVVGNEGGKFNSEILMQASTLCLCKFMCVSSSFCEKNLPLLFTALSNTPFKDVSMRSNTVVALGDLAFRFPNEFEPYTPHLYACLRDKSTKVRRHTLMVLTHLILNDMVKVKGQVCEIALCLKDEDSRIRDMSRLLFHELSKRSNNPVYNLLPEIVSQLSQVALVGKDDFRGIMSFLLGYIKKERQNEMLAEKLCQRFPKCSNVSQAADLAFCISQLKLSEKSIKCLSDNFNLYKDSLFDDDVSKCFGSIVTKAKKVIKPEKRQVLDEWEAKLNELTSAGVENERASKKAAKAKKRASQRAARKKKREMEQIVEEAEEEEEEEDELEFNEADFDKENSSSVRRSGRRLLEN